MVNRLFRCVKPILNLRLSVLPQTFIQDSTLCRTHRRIGIKLLSNIVQRSSYDRSNNELNDEQHDADKHQESRLLKIAIIGVPNAGKSTVINQLAGRRVCSISSKVHTTRCKARAIAIFGDTQLVFLDTPGLVSSAESQRHHLEHAFHSDSEMAMLEADVIGVVHDVSNPWTRHKLDPKVLRLLHLYPRKHSFLILNKIDLLKSKRNLLDIVRTLTNKSMGKLKFLSFETKINQDNSNIEKEEKNNDEKEPEDYNPCDRLSEWQVHKIVKDEKGWSNFREVFMISALTGDGASDVKDYLLHISEPSPWLYPPDQFTDQPSETVVLEAVKSKLLEYLPQEIPYNIKTKMEYFDIGSEGSVVAVVLLECPSLRLQKLVVGSRGMRIRLIARTAEQELQSSFREQVRLKVVVTTRNDQQLI